MPDLGPLGTTTFVYVQLFNNRLWLSMQSPACHRCWMATANEPAMLSAASILSSSSKCSRKDGGDGNADLEAAPSLSKAPNRQSSEFSFFSLPSANDPAWNQS
jgi:hypothetical protein